MAHIILVWLSVQNCEEENDTVSLTLPVLQQCWSEVVAFAAFSGQHMCRTERVNAYSLLLASFSWQEHATLICLPLPTHMWPCIKVKVITTSMIYMSFINAPACQECNSLTIVWDCILKSNQVWVALVTLNEGQGHRTIFTENSMNIAWISIVSEIIKHFFFLMILISVTLNEGHS